MCQCKTVGCGSYALNDDLESGLCDKCLYKIPLLNLLAVIHRDGGLHTREKGVARSAYDEEKKVLRFIDKA